MVDLTNKALWRRICWEEIGEEWSQLQVGISVELAFGGMSSQKIQHRVLDVLSSSSQLWWTPRTPSAEVFLIEVSISISRWSFLCPRAHGSADFCTGGGWHNPVAWDVANNNLRGTTNMGCSPTEMGGFKMIHQKRGFSRYKMRTSKD